MTPVDHAFTYPVTFFAFDLDELGQIDKTASLFGYNHVRPLQIKDCDYLLGKASAIGKQLNEFLPPQEMGERTLLVTSPKYFGYAFNPVNFYLRMRGPQLIYAVAEVNNTFGDRHIYTHTVLKNEGNCVWSASCPKSFHVSPFNDLDGEYRFTFRVEDAKLFLGVDLWKAGKLVMKTWIQGSGQPLTNQAIARYALLHPFDTALNSMPRILAQAAKLYYRKKMDVYKRPSPHSDSTVIDRDFPEGRRDVV